MVFIHDTQLALAAAVDLVNTLPVTSSEGHDGLVDIADLNRFLDERVYTGRLQRDAEELAALRAIRPRLQGLWGVRRDDAVPLVNAMLRDARALPQLVSHAGYEQWHIHAAEDDEQLSTRILVETAMAFIDVIRADEYDRVRVCSADDCRSVYIDYSRNKSKRYCDTGNCGNRMNVNAYRRRKAEETA
ncbi:CGNR zinc finger domain-containing protein [Microbacterium sp. cx-55]|uniref:CGNR zinc finger domain-containing protein n=1 Tax=Microbacterium sp. cx-55 TaxID=2875948 RepID=UPI001CC0C159|nr:CGNR zinc finger domain-containing protein [Microbacterium sp. cx-55]MBZ4486476.1 CGNR zinc finger domain-containing protein [Microbacterium sp. cx-55]UGB36554.1 CGNR zinc finger domain-containing protein [Microbacterium sp. cx-55]